MPDFLVYPIAFVVLLGIMVVVHEFGHFAVAKLCKVRVEAFSVGFGKRLFGIKYGDTDYKVCILPLGGYVKMAGELPGEEEPVNDPGAFNAHPRWQRMLIGAAGPVANFILAFVLMVFYFGWINEVPAVNTVKLEWVTPGSTAALAGLEAGDIVRQFDGIDNPDWFSFNERARKDATQTVPVSVERNGKLVQTVLRLPDRAKGEAPDLESSGIFLEEVQAPLGVKQVIPDSPAEKAGLQAGDTILSVDGHAFHTVNPLLDYLQSGKGKPITLAIVRNGAAPTPLVVHPYEQDSQWRIGFMWNAPSELPMRDEPLGFVKAVGESKDFCAESSLLIFGTIQKLLTHQASVKQLVGPLGIAQAAGDAAKTKDWSSKFGLAAGISLNLGILNLMPFPILDGGLILFLLIESLMRRDVDIVIKERIYQAAFVLIVFFAVFILFNDATRIGLFTHLKL
jgi:regulator of sigma E protease